MALLGINPNDPIPTTRRQFVLSAGPSAGGSAERRVLLVGNRTSAGDLAVSEVSRIIADDADARLRFGLRSELYAMYRRYVDIDPDATIHAIPVVEAGTAASATFTFATNSDAAGSVEVSCHGEVFEVSVATGDTPTVVAAAVVAAVTSQDEGRLQVTASNIAGVVTVTAAQNGPRGDNIIGSAANTRGVRMRMTRANAMTIAKGGFIAGATLDDVTLAAAAMANDEFFYQVLAHTGNTATVTDNQMGEWADTINTQFMPINGKEAVMFMGHVDTQANAQALAISAPFAQFALAKIFHQENNDWTPGMIAAHHAAIHRANEVAHPAANLAGYTNSTGRPYKVPLTFVPGDRPTDAEIRASLNNGVSPIAFRENGAAYLVRSITTASQNAGGQNDYRARSGHIPSVVKFFWDTVETRWETQKQPFVAADPVVGQQPFARTTTPRNVRGMIEKVIDDLASSKPLGQYDGPILAPDKVDIMKASLIVTKVTAGITVAVDVFAVEHLYKGEFLIRETGPSY